jgi:hypothetical protein
VERDIPGGQKLKEFFMWNFSHDTKRNTPLKVKDSFIGSLLSIFCEKLIPTLPPKRFLVEGDLKEFLQVYFSRSNNVCLSLLKFHYVSTFTTFSVSTPRGFDSTFCPQLETTMD